MSLRTLEGLLTTPGSAATLPTCYHEPLRTRKLAQQVRPYAFVIPRELIAAVEGVTMRP